jgi:hypothetical protein
MELSPGNQISPFHFEGLTCALLFGELGVYSFLFQNSSEIDELAPLASGDSEAAGGNGRFKAKRESIMKGMWRNFHEASRHSAPVHGICGSLTSWPRTKSPALVKKKKKLLKSSLSLLA